MRYENYKVFDAQANASVNSSKIDAASVIALSIQGVFTDVAATGTLKLQLSNDVCDFGNVASNFTPTNWTDITGASVAVAGTTPVAILLSTVSYRWIRVVWIRTAGAGTFTVSVKSIGY